MIDLGINDVISGPSLSAISHAKNDPFYLEQSLIMTQNCDASQVVQHLRTDKLFAPLVEMWLHSSSGFDMQ